MSKLCRPRHSHGRSSSAHHDLMQLHRSVLNKFTALQMIKHELRKAGAHVMHGSTQKKRQNAELIKEGSKAKLHKQGMHALRHLRLEGV